jgi:hypothetical protein
MDSADGLTPEQYAAGCGIGAAVVGERTGHGVFTDDDSVVLAAVEQPEQKSVTDRPAAAEATPTKTARSQANPAKRRTKPRP